MISCHCAARAPSRPQSPVALTGAGLLWLCCLAGPAPAAAEAGIETIKVVGTSVRERIEVERVEIAGTPGGVSLVDGDGFFERNVTSLADALRFVPGFWAVSESGNDGIFFSSRGSNLDATDYDMNGIKLLQDGLPITTADGNNHNRIVDPLSARFAVVARGANALSWGASTLGGAVNFLTPTAHDSPGMDLSLNGGSHGQLGGRASFGRVFDNGFDALLTVEGRTWSGWREHNDQERAGIYANAGWQLSDAVESRLYFNWVQNDRELPGSLSRAQLDADPDQASGPALGGDYRINVETWRAANRTSWRIDADRGIELGLSFEHQDLYHPIVDRILVDFDGPGPLTPTEVFSLLVDTEQDNFGAMGRYQHRAGDHELSFGVNAVVGAVTGGNWRNLHGRRNGLSQQVDESAHTIELFATDRWRIHDDWTVVLALQGALARRDAKTVEAAGGAVRNPEGVYRGFSPRIGVIYRAADGVDLYASASRLFEPPTHFELEDDVRGNEQPLAAMRGTVIEAGTRGRNAFDGGALFWELSLYYAWIDDAILSRDDPAAPGTSLSANVDDTVHAGVELLLGGEFGLGSAPGVIAPMLSLSLNEFSFKDDPIYGDNDLPAAPDHALRGEVLYRHPRGFWFGPTFDVIGKRWADFANSYRVGDYALLGLRSGWSNERLRLFLEARNLLDEDYVVSHSVRDRAGPGDAILDPGEPRSIYAGVQLRY